MKWLAPIFLLICNVAGAQKNTLLYKIEKSGYRDSYLFGTTHLIADTSFYFPQKLEKIIAGSEKIVLEIGNLQDEEKARSLMKLKEGSAFDMFSPEQKDSVIRWGSEALHMSPEAFEKGFSTRVPFSLMQIGLQKSMMQTPVKSFELEILGRARQHDIPVDGLETMEFQLGIFASMPDSVMAEIIMSEIRHPETLRAQDEKLTELYVNKDVEGLAEYLRQQQSDPVMAEALIYARNRNWISKIAGFMKSEKCFFAVGAGHLGGEQGVIQLLKNQGFEVTPVNY